VQASRLPVDLAARLVLQVLTTMRDLEHTGMQHVDVHLGNWLVDLPAGDGVTREGEARLVLADFGVARPHLSFPKLGRAGTLAHDTLLET
jgi:serine/threonine protein kinase